jgi:Putative beta-barrel porin-2, OmpL-like. bbp2
MSRNAASFASFLLCSALFSTALWAQDTAAQTPSQAPAQGSTQTEQPAPAGQTPSTAPAPAPAPAPTWSVGPIDFSGLIDGYYSFNNNHPTPSFNQLYNFDFRSNQFSLNMAKLTASHDPDPVGFRIDIGFGRAFDVIHSTEQAPDIFRYLEQAYVSWKPKSAHGFEADFGEFVTSAGAEVIETKDNWNYSRSLLFAWAIPYYHFGLRLSQPIGSFNVGVQVVNGWNNVEDNNSGKTVGITGGITRKKFTWSNNYYVGPEKTKISDIPHSADGNRNVYDTTLLLTPTDKFNAYLNFDYGQDKLALTPGHARWVGFAGAAHFQITDKIAFSPRAEWFHDADGFETGTRQTLHEVTLTGEYKMVEGLLARLEYRRDDSDTPFFCRGDCSSDFFATANSKSQSTVTLGIVAFFGPKR